MRWAGLGARASACPSHRGFWPRRCGPVPGQGAPSATASPSLCALSRLSPGFQPQEQVASNKAVSDSVSSGGSAGRCESPCGRGHGQKCGVRGALPTVGRSVGPGEVGSQASGRLSLARTAPLALQTAVPWMSAPLTATEGGSGGGGPGLVRRLGWGVLGFGRRCPAHQTARCGCRRWCGDTPSWSPCKARRDASSGRTRPCPPLLLSARPPACAGGSEGRTWRGP